MQLQMSCNKVRDRSSLQNGRPNARTGPENFDRK
jgi:hypothetical protein